MSGLPPGAGRRVLLALTRRELVRIVRQPSRIVAALATPALLWAFLAGGFAGAMGGPGAGGGEPYGAYLLPGMAVAVALFSSIFSAMSLIEDRQAGFLQAALVSPAPPWATLGAKILGGAAVATAQAGLVLLAAPLVGPSPTAMGVVLALAACVLASAAVTALGLGAAWWVNSSQGFHGVMNLVLMPMWLLSGAFFPAESAAGWLRWLMAANPLRWSTEAIRDALTPGGPRVEPLAWGIAAGFAVAAAAWAIMAFRLTGNHRARRDP